MARKDVGKKKGMSGKLANIEVLARHVADMSPTFPTKHTTVLGLLANLKQARKVKWSVPSWGNKW